jgi:hypothetical protein
MSNFAIFSVSKLRFGTCVYCGNKRQASELVVRQNADEPSQNGESDCCPKCAQLNPTEKMDRFIPQRPPQTTSLSALQPSFLG